MSELFQFIIEYKRA